MTRDTADALIRNLKLLNAKERDHLMRFAYLGQSASYDTASMFLAPELDATLREHALGMGLSRAARCVFAGMDYHLDWLFAALWMAHAAPDWAPPQESPRVPMAAYVAVEGIEPLYTDFRPVTGSQEDIDLLAIFDDGNMLAVLLVEAKGSAAFDKVQLARKLIRLNRIVDESGVASQAERRLQFRLILAAPGKPTFECCRSFAMSLPEAIAEQPDKFDAMRKALKNLKPDGIGHGLHFLEISGFPEQAYAVERLRTNGPFTNWTLRRRK